LSEDNLCENDLGIVVGLIVSEKVKIILTNFCENGYCLGAETKWDRVKPVNGISTTTFR
jgi:hypothetical protein